MKQPLAAEVVVLDRIMYLLEEKSVSHLTEVDETFRSFVHELYQHLNNHSRQLQTSHA